MTFQNHMQLSRHQRLTKMEHWHGREQMKNTTASIQFPLSEAALPANPRMILKMKVKSLSRVQLFATPWTTSLLHLWGFSRQEYWSGLPFPSPGPFVLCLHPQVFLQRGVLASGSFQEWTVKLGSFDMWHHPRGYVSNFLMRPASS